MMQQLATGLLTSGDTATNFTRYSELASVQQNYLQQMGALWVNRTNGSWRLSKDECASAAFAASIVPASAVERNQAIENCRKTVGKPIVTACMRSGGSIEACRGSARPQVRACVQSAMGGQQGMKGCNNRTKVSGAPCL
jgi:hypothetical protein